MKHFAIFILLFISFSFMLYSNNTDTIASRKSLFLIPHAAYQQETSWSGGVAFGYYFKSNDVSRISSISGSAVYTVLNQFMLNISPKLYFSDKKYFLYANLNLRNYPDYYFGIGNKPQNLKVGYVSRNFNVTLQPQYLISKELYVGLSLSYKTENLQTDSSYTFLQQNIYTDFGNAGWKPYGQFTAGIVAAYDSRDNQFYPEKGLFAKIMTGASPAWLGNTFSLNEFSVDVRKYQPLFKMHNIAFQAYVSGMFGQNGIPFQLLPTLGGRDLMRGFRQGMYRENLLFLVQSEYRLPIYKRLKAAFFCSAGDVINSSDFKVDKLKIGYGAGLRYRLNDARVHLRFDIAKNNYGEKLQFYITATEAF
jgi:outer membrane protein assembly factor BamA